MLAVRKPTSVCPHDLERVEGRERIGEEQRAPVVDELLGGEPSRVVEIVGEDDRRIEELVKRLVGDRDVGAELAEHLDEALGAERLRVAGVERWPAALRSTRGRTRR